MVIPGGIGGIIPNGGGIGIPGIGIMPGGGIIPGGGIGIFFVVFSACFTEIKNKKN